MSGISDIFIQIIAYIIELFSEIFSEIFAPFGEFINGIGFNIYLFSDTGWFTEPIPILLLIGLIIFTLMFIFLLRLLWKGTKKFISMIFGVFKL